MLALLLDDHLKEEACMKYINAKNLLPDVLVKELQSYIQGGYLYVPADQAQQKRWGEASGLPTGIAAAKPPNRRGISKRNLYGGTGGKILLVRIRHSENHLSEMNWQGLQKCSLCFLFDTD